MKNVGFIGYGSMGSMLIHGMIDTQKLVPKQVWVATKTQEKLKPLKERYLNIQIAGIVEVARQSDVLFICVKPMDVYDVLQEICPSLKSDIHLVSIAACVTIKKIAMHFSGKITKIIPSLTSEVREGISLVCHNSQVTSEDRAFLEKLFSAISTVKNISEEDFEAGADLTSCAPGLFSAIFQQFVDAGVRNSGIESKEAEEMVIATLYGTIKLLKEKGMNFHETIQRVATKGGITEEGVRVLNEGLPKVFDQVFQKTLGKHEIVKEKIQTQFQKNDQGVRS